MEALERIKARWTSFLEFLVPGIGLYCINWWRPRSQLRRRLCLQRAKYTASAAARCKTGFTTPVALLANGWRDSSA